MKHTNREKDGKSDDFFSHIKKISEINKQAGGLNDLFFEFAGPHLKYLCDLLGVSPIGASLLAGLAHLYRGGLVELVLLATYLHLDSIEVIQYMEELEILAEKNLITIRYSNPDVFDTANTEKLFFELRISTIDALRKGNYQNMFSTESLTIDDFFLHLEHLCEDRVQRKQPYKNTIRAMKRLLSDNGHLGFVKKIKKLQISDDDILILLRFFHYTVTMEEPDMTFRHLMALYDHFSQFSLVKRLLRNGQYVLITKGLIENTCTDGFSSAESFRLTEYAKEEFLIEMDVSLPAMRINGLKNADAIAEKHLFYPEKSQMAITELTALLQPENFEEVQKRLAENSMRTGFACLFSGTPGTGKTETAYQIARICGRDIMQVDIAGIKSKWFGDSEKQIKAIFNKYRNCVKRSAVTPILLFNEADALISKRQILDESGNGPRQTENAIQNIILQEIEDLNGILIATTNLTKNMDAAFERRFLYKIEFEKPQAETRKVIWRSLLSGLSDDDAWSLASRFDFSGGQIENISRKTTVHRVLSGKDPVLEDMMQYCLAECSEAQGDRKIGFVA